LDGKNHKDESSQYLSSGGSIKKEGVKAIYISTVMKAHKAVAELSKKTIGKAGGVRIKMTRGPGKGKTGMWGYIQLQRRGGLGRENKKMDPGGL